ncbi:MULTISPECIES: hypothetical protein [Vibrio]|jgi:hypothetical protein|uniref:hypothetical protein n=1 Tax=Vibrio TaxID=662 RepID=UPI0014835717|nr:hypothetical protein [Vibrio sp. 11-4(1)]EGQ7740922.1 hypothetical protein [Vibrio parahaemolyticus]EIL2908441.1 hypothetical protein [Vibrio alginolyticus]EJG1399023.1 hypothetical protein [Vibrio parahaemolyticus]EJS0370536.1 hypothetical protein [Vibrio alginolyticus]NNN82149.1 hypothetical protein [Vibrio sp. 11-4(1)]
MTLESALNAWLSQLTGLDCYWLNRPESADNAVVYRCITPGFVDGNLRKTGIQEDVYSLTIYHQDPDQGKSLADQISKALEQFTGELNPGTEQAYRIQLAELSGGFDQPLLGESGPSSYQFNRDFLIKH